MTIREVVAVSELDASPETVWERVTSIDGINDELAPWLRMTAPAGMALTPAAAPLGRRWFRSWVLLLGIVPIDYDDLCLERLEPPRGFLERSRMLSARVWQHERALEEIPRGTRLRDAVAFEPRLPIAGALHRAVIASIFRHRHRRLRAHFGSPPPVLDPGGL
jgi:ligand-binding SRPBCC domain-containing protein